MRLRAGLSHLDGASGVDLMDHHVMEVRLAAAPAGRLLGKPAYHALTYGWLMSGLARAVTDKGMRELIRVELAQPLNTDGLHLGDHRPTRRQRQLRSSSPRAPGPTRCSTSWHQRSPPTPSRRVSVRCISRV